MELKNNTKKGLPSGIHYQPTKSELDSLRKQLFNYTGQWAEIVANELEVKRGIVYAVFRKDCKDRHGVYTTAKNLLERIQKEVA